MPLLAVTSELGNELRHRIVQADAPLLDELHHAGRRRDDFRERRHVEDSVFRHRLDAMAATARLPKAA